LKVFIIAITNITDTINTIIDINFCAASILLPELRQSCHRTERQQTKGQTQGMKLEGHTTLLVHTGEK